MKTGKCLGVSLCISLFSLLINSCGNKNTVQQPEFPTTSYSDYYSDAQVANAPNQETYFTDLQSPFPPFIPKTYSYQDILNSWDIDKNDKGLTYKEIKDAVDKDKNGEITFEELKINSLNDEDSMLVIQKLKEFPQNDNQLIYELVELDSRVFPGGISKISESDIQQGKRNVCYFIASLSGLAYHRRTEDILGMIDKNRDGTFTVSFPGTKTANKYTIPYPTETDLSELIFKGKNGSSWAAILVNAYNKYAEKGRPFKHIFAGKYVSDYGLTWEGIETQTGHKSDSYLLDFFKTEKFFATVKKALDNKKVVTVCTFLKGNISTWIDPKKNEVKFSIAHVLTLTAVDPEKKTVTIRDPYGQFQYYDQNGKTQTDKTTDGFITLSVEDLKKYFLDIAIETDQKGVFEGIRNIFNRLN